MAATIAETDCVVHEQFTGTTQPTDNPFEIKWVAFETPDTVDDGDAVTITLANYGITSLYDVMCWTHTTTDDVIITEATEIVTDVTTGTLTATIQGSTDNKKRVLLVGGI